MRRTLHLQLRQSNTLGYYPPIPYRCIHIDVYAHSSRHNRPKKIIADVVYIYVKPIRNRKCVGRFASLLWHTYDFYASKSAPRRDFNCLHNWLLYGYYMNMVIARKFSLNILYLFSLARVNDRSLLRNAER